MTALAVTLQAVYLLSQADWLLAQPGLSNYGRNIAGDRPRGIEVHTKPP